MAERLGSGPATAGRRDEASFIRGRAGRLWLNAALFQAGWLACVLGAARGWPWLGPAAGAAILLAHFALMTPAGRAPEARLLLAGAAIGLLADGGMQAAGIIRYGGWPGAPWLPPLWLLTLWLLFASTLRHSLAWLRGRRPLGAVLGAFLGPLSYYGGARLGALALGGSAPSSLLVLATVWALVMPLLLTLARR